VLAASRLVALMTDEGFDANLPEFAPSTSELQYRNPSHYREMLESVNAVEVKRITDLFSQCIVFSIQIDGSLSKHMQDNKFTSCRMAMQDGNVKTFFMFMHSPNENGSQGLLEAVNESRKIYGCNSNKLVGITTDGESANTGKNAGLWKLLSDQCDREILTFWCCAHRSDLAAESVIQTVPELKIWKANLLAVATYFRTSKNKTKLLSAVLPNAKKFPRHHEVRFAQHQVALIDAVLSNMPGCLNVWAKMDEVGDRKEKAEARGFLKTWRDRQGWLTELMGDILEVYQTLQKQLQRDDLVLCDLLTCKDSALRKLQLMQNGPYPGKREAKSQFNITDVQDGRAAVNSLVSTNHQNIQAIRVETVQAAYNFLNERIDNEQNAILKTMKDLLLTQNMTEFITTGLPWCVRLFPGQDGQFADEICEQWNAISDVSFLPEGSDLGCTLSVRLRKLLRVTTGLVQKIFAAIATLSPHSMQTERIVSHHNMIVDDDRSSMNDATINCRLNIALNGVGTAFYDPRPAVVHFLEVKERRNKNPDKKVYSARKFVKKIYRPDGHF